MGKNTGSQDNYYAIYINPFAENIRFPDEVKTINSYICLNNKLDELYIYVYIYVNVHERWLLFIPTLGIEKWICETNNRRLTRRRTIGTYKVERIRVIIVDIAI